MRILFTRFPLQSHYGGAEVQTLTLMKGLRERGHEVSFLGSCPVLLAESVKCKVKSEELRLGPPPVTKWGAVSFAWRRWGMKRKLIVALTTLLERRPQGGVERPPPDFSTRAPRSVEESGVVLMLSLSEKLLLTDWLTKQGVRVFWIEHDRVGRWLTRNPWLPRLRTLSTLATTVVVSDLSRDIYLTLGWPEERTMSIPNGIDLQRFTPSQRGTRNEERGTLRVGCVARLTHDKGVDLLIEAVAKLSDVELTIVGTGKEELNLREQINQSTNKRINLLPHTPDLPNFYTSQDVMTLPSREHDPFGLVAAEAMASGVPVIVTDACGIARHLREGEALIVPAGSAEALREAIEKVRDPSLRSSLATSGRAAALDQFGADRMVAEYAALLEER